MALKMCGKKRKLEKKWKKLERCFFHTILKVWIKKYTSFFDNNCLSFIDPASSTGNGIYSSFRNRNFWLEYSTPPTTKYPDYDEYYYNYGSTIKTTTPDPGPRFKDVMSNHSLVQVPIGSTAFLHCKVENLRDFQVSFKFFFHLLRNSIFPIEISGKTDKIIF